MRLEYFAKTSPFDVEIIIKIDAHREEYFHSIIKISETYI